MASSRRTKLRITASVLFATGFWDALAGRFLFAREATRPEPTGDEEDIWPYEDWRGALHVHSTYSDGAGDIPTVMAAAAATGVDFVLLCDHNTQQPLRDGWEARYPNRPVLLIGTEVTVEQGAFLLALDMPPTWEPTRDQTPQVAIDEVRAQGGLPLISLPFDIKHPWRDWDAGGYAGLEVVNFSTVARRHINLLSLAWLLPLFRLRGMAAVLRAIATRPDQALARWDAATEEGKRSSVGIGALDAHALMKIGKNKYPIPSYEDSFRAVATHVFVPADTLAADRPRALYAALRAGHCYFSYDCVADPNGFRFSATTGTNAFIMGDRIPRADSNTVVSLTAVAPDGTLLRLYRNGEAVTTSRTGALHWTTTEPGAYRIEGYRYQFRIGRLYAGVRPQIFSNPLYID
jgi:hypothetical protein